MLLADRLILNFCCLGNDLYLFLLSAICLLKKLLNIRNMTHDVLVMYDNVIYDSSEPCQALKGR